MKFEIEFGNPATGKVRTIAVELDAREIEAARAHPHPDIAVQCHALSHAYRMVPEGFQHLRGGIKPLWTQ